MLLWFWASLAKFDSYAKRGYICRQVLKTPTQRKAAPVRSCGFFTPIGFLWAGVRGIQDRATGNISADCVRFSAPARPAENGDFAILNTKVQF